MSDPKYYALPGDAVPQSMGIQPESAWAPAVWMDSTVVKDCMFCQASWLKTDCTRPGMIKHESDALLMFVGGDVNNYESLNGEIELWIENDKLVLPNTCFVFVPAGVAYGNMTVRNVTKPIFYYCVHMNASDYVEIPAEATVPAGKYANNFVEKYIRDDGITPEAPEGFLDFLLWIDGAKLAGAPYMEAVWFKTKNETGPMGHSHVFDEIIGFIGSDPEHPEELGAQVMLALGERIITTEKSTLFYIPRGINHSPIVLPKLDRPIYHFSGGNGGDYVRT